MDRPGIQGSDVVPPVQWTAPLSVVLSDGTQHLIRGRRAAFIRHLVERGAHLDAPAYRVGKMEFAWADGKKLDVSCVRFTRDQWPKDGDQG